MSDYYQILELPRAASRDDIKRSYKRLAMRWHPDRNPNNIEEATSKIKEINEAYSVLVDAEKRAKYDQFGKQGLMNAQAEAAPNGFPFPFDIFFRQQAQNNDFRVEIAFTLRELYNGVTKKIKVTRNVLCAACNALGVRREWTGSAFCSECKGQGTITKVLQLAPGFITQQQSECPACSASGIQAQARCQPCGGKKVTRAESVVEVCVPKGTKPGSGSTIVIPNMADEIPGQPTGNLIVQVATTGISPSEPNFKLAANQVDLNYEATISLKQALCETSFSLQHLDGRKIIIDTTGDIISHGFVKVVPGEGLTKGSNLLVTFHVAFPQLDPAIKTKLREILPS
jgi:DnaJ-class molecular chaperone